MSYDIFLLALIRTQGLRGRLACATLKGSVRVLSPPDMQLSDHTRRPAHVREADVYCATKGTDRARSARGIASRIQGANHGLYFELLQTACRVDWQRPFVTHWGICVAQQTRSDEGAAE